MAATTASEIVRRLREHGFQAWLVGGCVRDRLLDISPKDYDVATDARPGQLTRIFPGAELIGASFGVVLVDRVEIATFRSERAYRDGRHPDEVLFESDPRLDALRRDFTINALFQDPFSGQILDFVNGREDLRNGIIRAIGDPVQRFREDHLRLLRAIRFAARFGYRIEPSTFAAIRELRGLIHHISAERVRDEIFRILSEGGARRGFELLDESGLLEELLPEVKAFQGVQQPPQFHPEGDVWTHVLLMLEQMGKASHSLAMGVLLHDVGKPGTFRVADRIRFDGHVDLGVRISRDILHRLKVSNDLGDRICDLVAYHMHFKDVQRMKQSTLKRFLRLPNFDEHLALHRLDCLSSNRNLENYEFCLRKLEELPAGSLRPPRILTGDDLIAAGFTPGPAFGRALQAVEDAQLEGRVADREAALEIARAVLHPPNHS